MWSPIHACTSHPPSCTHPLSCTLKGSGSVEAFAYTVKGKYWDSRLCDRRWFTLIKLLAATNRWVSVVSINASIIDKISQKKNKTKKPQVKQLAEATLVKLELEVKWYGKGFGAALLAYWHWILSQCRDNNVLYKQLRAINVIRDSKVRFCFVFCLPGLTSGSKFYVQISLQSNVLLSPI